MNTCRALVWDGIDGDRCGRDAPFCVGKYNYCERCVRIHTKGNLGYSEQYLISILEKINSLDVNLLSESSDQLEELKSLIKKSLDIINLVKATHNLV